MFSQCDARIWIIDFPLQTRFCNIKMIPCKRQICFFFAIAFLLVEPSRSVNRNLESDDGKGRGIGHFFVGPVGENLNGSYREQKMF